MKKLVLIVFLLIQSFAYGANVYFDLPSNNQSFQIDANGNAGVSYHLLTVSLFFVTDWYGARVQYPDGHWGSWQTGQSGGWVFSQAGTYHLQGAVHVVSDLNGGNNYFMYSNILTFYVTPPPQPLTNVSIFGDFSLYLGSTGYWNATLTNGIAPFTYNWQIMYLGSISSYSLGSKSLTTTDKIGSGGIIINAPPSEYWFSVGTNSPTFSRTNTGSDPRDFKLRCIVTDASNTTKTSNEWYVDVLSEYPPQMSIVQNNSNIPKASLAKESLFEQVPTEYLLKQNYPNPFNPTTTIEYQLPSDGFVSLKIFDLLGSEIKTLVNDFKTKGRYSITFDASNLASGLYIYQIKSNNFSSIKKMILSK